MRFGIAMSPLNVSAMLQSRPRSIVAPTMATRSMPTMKRFVDFGSKDGLDTSCSVQSPADDGGKVKAAHRHSGKDGYPAAVGCGESTDGQLRSGIDAVVLPEFRCTRMTRAVSVQITMVSTNTSKIPKTCPVLRDFCICGGVCNGAGSKSGFI